MEPPPSRQVAKQVGGLAGIVGLGAALLLFTDIPADESGRKVEATIAEDGTPTIRHLSGRQYLRAYRDIVGVPTACDGITRDVQMGRTFTEAECTAMLERELIVHARGVMACTPGLHGPGRDNQRYAAVSLAYNVGVGAYCRSTARARFNAGNYVGGCEAIGPRFTIVNSRGQRVEVNGFVKAGGRIVPGLVRRRQRERAVCLRGL